jgi:hypothetical protein
VIIYVPINGLHTERTALEPYWCQGYERGGSLRIAAFMRRGQRTHKQAARMG